MAKRFNSLNDCKRFLARVANDLNDNEITPEKARALGYLVAIMQKILEGGEIEQRLAKLEAEVEKGER